MYLVVKPFEDFDIYYINPVINKDTMETLVDSHIRQLTNRVKILYATNLGFDLREKYDRMFGNKYQTLLKAALVVDGEYLENYFIKFPKEELNKAFPDK